MKEHEECTQLQQKRYLVNDSTIEKLLMIIQDNPQGLLLFRDELSGWLETMNKSGREGDREFFLESWNGDAHYEMDRVGRGNTFVDGFCLSVFGGLQPSKLDNYVSSVSKGGKSDDGLLQRFQILLYPERRKKWKKVDRKPDAEVEQQIQSIVEGIDSLPAPKREDDNLIRSTIRFSEEAQPKFFEWLERLEDRLDSGRLPSILENHMAKYRKLLPTLALIFETVQSYASRQTVPDSVSLESLELASNWCDFLEKHACKAYGEYLEPEMAAARKVVEKIEAGSVNDYDRSRDLYRRGWKGVTTCDAFESAMKILKRHGYARTEIMKPANGGKTEVVRLHPSLRK